MKRQHDDDVQDEAAKESKVATTESVIRFYSGKKGGVAYKYNNNPLIPKDKINEYEWLSNFYPAPFTHNGIEYKSSEHYFQARRFERVPSLEDMCATQQKCFVNQQTDEMRALRREFIQHIVDAKTPNSALFLNHYVSFRKRDGAPYVNAPYPHMKQYADMIMRFYNKGLRRFKQDNDADVEIMLQALRLKFGQSKTLRDMLLATGDDRLIEHTRRDALWGDAADGSGQNQLGKCLMRVREELRG